MMAGDWLAAKRTEVGAEAILNAAELLFTERAAASVGMNEIARAAGCSRATLYRYFENRDALHLAYVHRETYRVFTAVGEQIAIIADPRARLLEGVMIALHSVRESPALSSWFATSAPPIGGEVAAQSAVINGLVTAFLSSLGVENASRPANLLVRMMVSLLMFPGIDEADERAMLGEFVVAQLIPVSNPATSLAPADSQTSQ